MIRRRITITRTIRAGFAVLNGGIHGGWHVVPSTYNGIGWSYDWSNASQRYRTKREATEAKRRMTTRARGG